MTHETVQTIVNAASQLNWWSGENDVAWRQRVLLSPPVAKTEIIYDTTCGWERDFLLRDVLPPAACQMIAPPDIATAAVTQPKCVLVFSSNTYGFETINALCARLRPAVIVHCSDEYGDRPLFDQLADTGALYFRQHRHRYLDNPRVHYLPLGYNVGIFSESTLSHHPRSLASRELLWAFVGNVKSDRAALITAFQSLGRGFSGRADARMLREIYEHAKFVPVGRGNASLNCFRIYEAAACGAIPVVVGSADEIKHTFQDEGAYPWLSANSWDAAVNLCREMLCDEQRLTALQAQVIAWWRKRITHVRSLVRNALLTATL